MPHVGLGLICALDRLLRTRVLFLLVTLSIFMVLATLTCWSMSLAALDLSTPSKPPSESNLLRAIVSSRELSLEHPGPTCTPPSGLIISEFRLRGANGVNDEFVEFYNNTDQDITVCTADGSNGWALVSSDGIVRFVIPVNTVIPARAHFLAVGSGYSLASYAAVDLSYFPDTPDNLGLALFNTASSINFTVANRLDAVGFVTTANGLYREGTGLPTLMSTNGQYSFVRKLASGFPQDTGNNSADFDFVATDGGNYGVIAILGAPGPENSNSPIQRNAQLPVTMLDPAVGANVAPNRIRDTTGIGSNAAAGTLVMRRKITNNTNGVVTRLRVRLVDLTTLNTPGHVPGGAQADMRALSSNDMTVTLSNGTQVLVRGTTVETPPQQQNGGGLNSSLGLFAYSLSQPLAPGASTNVQFLLGVQQSGTFRFFINVEAVANSLPSALAGGPYSGPTGSPIQFNGSGSYDLEGPVDTYQWNFGDNSSGSGPAPSRVYTTAGTYTVTLTVTDSAGLTNTGSTTATIYPASNKLPVANIAGSYSAITGTATQFSASGSFDPDGSIMQFRWDFAGLGTGAGATPSFIFTNTGTHLVSLTVTDNVGAKTLTSINVTVSAPAGGEQVTAGDSNVSDWDAINRRSLDDPINDRGNLANKATGNNNFQIVAPVLSLPGRGIDLNLNLVYNSLVWNKSGNDMYFDIDHDTPAPGWHLGFGKMVLMGTAGCMLIEPDGSRHPFKGTVFSYHYGPNGSLPAVDIPVFKGETTDGSMIEYRCEPPSWQNPRGVARYPNGTVVHYTNLSSGTQARNYLYPTRIVDKNGNSITILYTWPDAEPRIQRVVDSVGRVINFRYDAQKRLTSITGPGLRDASGNPTTQTFVRLHYTTRPLGLSGAFTGNTHVRNSSPFVIDAIYYPATGTGYSFGPEAYSSYGMLWKVTQQRGMGFSPGANPDEQGTITQGTVTRTQTYDYHTSPSNLTSAPVFNNVSETWDGGTAVTTTNFVVQENATSSERTATVSNPDGTRTVQIAFSLNSLADSDPNKFRNGLTREERKLDANGALMQKTVFTWEPGPNGTPRLQRMETTDERGQVLATAYDQYGDNNGVGRTRELDYSGAVLRTTVNTFLSYLDGDLDQGIDTSRGISVLIHPRLVNLVASTKLYEGDDSVNALASLTEFRFDEYAETLKAYPADGESSLDLLITGLPRPSTGIIGILQHAPQFNPSPSQADLNGGFGADYFTKRGNVTSITRYADTSNAAAPSSPMVERMKYDMAGNVITSSRLCCEELSANFDSLATQFAFPISQTRGAADPASTLRVTTSTTYDLAAGLPLSVTDANGRTVQTSYIPTSLRPKEIILPTGARTVFEYDDAAMKVVQTTRLSASGPIASQTAKYFNGLGQVKKEEALGANGAIDIVELLYDQFGRPSKQSRPYRSGQSPQWQETVYDAAGRIAEAKERAGAPTASEPINSTTKHFYNESNRPAGASNEPGQTTRTVDAWQRWRWVRVDAAGRLAEVVEPNPTGGPGFRTSYSYNALNKLVRVEQDVQVRRFRYDSLGRLTHQKLAETEATLNLSGQWSTAGAANDRWSEVFIYDERSNLISKTDARGVKTIFRYKDSNNVDDPLNRLQSVSYELSGVPASLTVLPAPTVTYQYRTKASAATPIDVTQIRQVVAAGVSTEDYDYDGEGRIQEKRLTFAGRSQPMTLTYTYDALNRITQTTYPQQYRDNITNPVRKTVVPSYDASSRVAGLKVNNVDYASQITYNPESQITSLTVGPGVNQTVENYIFNPLTGLLTEQNVMRGDSTLFSISYGYSLRGCTANCPYTGQITSSSDSISAGVKLYGYDELGRLNGIKGGVRNLKNNIASVTWSQDYTYDRFGNRLFVSTFNEAGSNVPSDGWSSLTYDQLTNRITSSGFSYDPAGNQLQNNTGQSFVYDAAGRLVKVKNQSGATVATYTYGASNRRLITQTGSETSTDKTYYIWEEDSVIAEYIEQPTATMPKWSKNYIYLGGRLLATEAPNGSGEIVHYHHPDHLGTRFVTNNLDANSFYQSTLPFGAALESESTDATNRRFTSYDRSAATDLDYAVNRQYDSRQGRFTQVDPLGMAAASLADPQTLNMYSYVGNDPVNRVDPDGQFWGALFRFIAGLFTNLRPNVINGSFTYRNTPPISVSFTPNFQNIGVGFAGIGFDLRSGGHWLPSILGSGESVDPQNAAQNTQQAGPTIAFAPAYQHLVQPFQDAFNEVVKRLNSKSNCAKLFGGLQNALTTLNGATYRLFSVPIKSTIQDGKSVPSVVGAMTAPGNTVFINLLGPFFLGPNLTANGNRTFKADFGTRLTGKELAALILFHELGHQIKKWGKDSGVGDKATNLKHTMDAYNACF